MSTHIDAILNSEPTSKWAKMRAAWDSCMAAGVVVPAEVQKFFGHENPDSKGLVMRLDKHPSVSEWADPNNDTAQGFEVDVSKLPKDVKYIRFYTVH